MIAFFKAVLYTPFYNGLLFLITIVPNADMGIAVILLTIAVKLALVPLSFKSIDTQLRMKEIEPKIKEIKEQYKHDRQAQSLQIMQTYKEHEIKPFSSFLLIFAQIPVIFALYFVFLKGGFPEIDFDLTYSFLKLPSTVNMHFLGILDISKKSIILAIIVGASQFLQARLMATKPEKKTGDKPSLKEDLAQSMHFQIRYVFPGIITIIASQLPAAVSLYWITSNVFSILQELYVRKTIRPLKTKTTDKTDNTLQKDIHEIATHNENRSNKSNT